MNILILNPSANYPRLRAGNGVFQAKKGMLHFGLERANEWYIRFVNTKMTKKLLNMAFAVVEKEVNRVRENERGWDALNENFNSPVHETVVETSLYAFLRGKTPFTPR